MHSRWVRASSILVVAGLLGATTTLDSAAQASQAASNRYNQARNSLLRDVQIARGEGFSTADLVDISSGLTALDAATPPSLGADAGAFYLAHADVATQLDLELSTRRTELLASTSGDARAEIQNATAGVARDQHLGALDIDLAPLQQRLGAAGGLVASARTIGDWRKAGGEVTSIASDAAALASWQQAENVALQQASAALIQQTSGNIDAIRKAGSDAQANGRNDASVASYEALPGRFKNIGTLMGVYNHMEAHAAQLGSGDVNAVATGSAAVQRYAGQVHQLMVQGLGPKHLVVNFTTQHFWAYENGNVVAESPTTTGIRGITAYGTDFGPMKILYRSHPWKMHSPFPKGTPHWYPDTVVQWTAFFTWSGESFHEAYWEPDSQLGPGSQYNSYTRSHGCVHVPNSDAQFLFHWASEGTPVDVFPGNGQPVAEQLSEMTTDSKGNPLSPA
jgi:lipoprotein-anchoring transpeptidase ErfK/SrfK